MAFSDFKEIPDVQAKFGIRHTEQDFVHGEMLNPSAHFLQEFAFKQEHIAIFGSEAARCEAIIFPVLLEVYKAYAKDYALWIGKSIAYDETLTGAPDYLVSTRSALGPLFVGHPLIMLVKAKKNDFDMGWGQCLAELVAAQKINNDADIPVHGIVTDGKSWEFGRLVGDGFTQNITPFLLANLPELFGALDAVFKAATEAATPNA